MTVSFRGGYGIKVLSATSDSFTPSKAVIPLLDGPLPRGRGSDGVSMSSQISDKFPISCRHVAVANALHTKRRRYDGAVDGQNGEFELRMELFLRGVEGLKKRHDALTMSLKRSRREIQELMASSELTGEYLLALVRIAEA